MIRVRGLELPEVIRDPLGSFVHHLRRSLPAEDSAGEVAPDIQQHPARDLLRKGVALGRAGRADEAFGAYDELLKQFVETKEAQEEVVWALLNMALILAGEGRTDDEEQAENYGYSFHLTLQLLTTRELLHLTVEPLVLQSFWRHGRGSARLIRPVPRPYSTVKRFIFLYRVTLPNNPSRTLL